MNWFLWLVIGWCVLNGVLATISRQRTALDENGELEINLWWLIRLPLSVLIYAVLVPAKYIIVTIWSAICFVWIVGALLVESRTGSERAIESYSAFSSWFIGEYVLLNSIYKFIVAIFTFNFITIKR